MKFAIVAHKLTETNNALAAAGWLAGEAVVLTPTEALDVLAPGDVALGRLDIRPTLDGVERGFRKLGRLSARGVQVLNPPSTLLATHDKLITAARLRRAGIEHPRTTYLTPGGPTPRVEPPVVVKPRFGSWGRDVYLCESRRSLEACIRRLRARSWFGIQGALIQELVPPQGYDVRLVIAGGEVVGAIRRVAAPGEWRTNVALGGHRERVQPDPGAVRLALAAAAAVGGDLVGVDLLPTSEGRYVVLELNGAVDFTADYSIDGDVFLRTSRALGRVAVGYRAAATG